MKVLYFLAGLLLGMLILGACSEDQGNYDYTNLAELSIGLPGTDFSVPLGGTLAITPSVKTDIPESDLVYQWEICVSSAITGTAPEYCLLSEGKNLNYVCNVSEYIPSPGNYSIRLHARQTSIGRDFYSDVARFTISGITGMMVMHDDGSKSDIGIITDGNFRPRSTSEIPALSINPTFYSDNNGGAKINGVGRNLLQLFGGSASFTNYHAVVALTDREDKVLNYSALVDLNGGWTGNLFYGALNKGQAQTVIANTSDPAYTYADVYIFDGGELFGRQNSEFVLRPALGNQNAYLLGYNLAPYLIFGGSGGSGTIQAYLFDTDSQAIIAVTQTIELRSTTPNQSRIFPLEVTGGKFNPAHMNADMLYWAPGGLSSHVLGVMQRADGSKFIAEINTNTGNDYSLIPVATYEMDHLPEIDQATHYAFVADGNTIYACYYATPNGVYRFTVDGHGTTIDAEPLRTLNGGAWDSKGEKVTMMTVMSHLGEEWMMIATYNEATKTGTLHCMTIDTANGAVRTDEKTYTGFGHISRICLKHL